MDEHGLLLYLAGVPVLGVTAQWLAWKLRLPSILLLLTFGIVLGTFLNPDALLAELVGTETGIGPKLLFPVVSLSVAVVLFEGGLTLRLHELKQVGAGVLRLVSIGAAISWLLTALFARQCFGLNWHIATLLGAVLVVTGPTVIAPMLRHIRPTRTVGSIVKWEGIVIDPIGAVLAVLVFEQAFRGSSEASFASSALILGRTALIGGVIGVTAAVLLAQCIKRYWIPDYLHGVVVLGVVLGTFALSNRLQHESGLVTVTVLGVWLANQRSVSIEHITEFKEHLGVFLISCLFIVLGSRLNVSDLAELGVGGAAFLALMILVVRPVSVFVATIGTRLSWRERLFVGCLAPRGIVAAAVSSVFALQLSSAAAGEATLLDQTAKIVPVTFLVIIGTVSVYGLLAAPLARLLKLADPSPQGVLFAGAEPWVREIAETLSENDISVFLVDTNYGNVAAARMQGLRAECASVLSEQVREETDLAGIGRLLAMTSNDEVNALATREFAHLFGRANVYQLPPWDTSAGQRTSVGERLRGRLLFDKSLHHDEFEIAYRAGSTLKKTNISKEFTFDDFLARYGDKAIVLFVLDESNKLHVCTADKPPEPDAGQSLIFLAREPTSVPARRDADSDT